MNRIVCAALKNEDGDIVLCIRHYDHFSRDSLSISPDDVVEQGFVDKNGRFLTRTEAWKVAEEAGQIIRRVGGDTANAGTLYSENLY